MAEKNHPVQIGLPDEAATIELARGLAPAVGGGGVVYLRGELGAGKTSFARGLLRALGAGERVKSPTYSLLERYTLGARGEAFHLDLYRIGAPEELEWLGMDELGDPAALVLIEWPERGTGALPAPDLDVALEYRGHGRAATLSPCTARGAAWLRLLGSVAASS
ncbi:MAG: tRNA (adenosine(37)-N6)-threonylcarbamoyltransferase complex ATPase subunit type 1 TsaE [Proteobacteria bacterium]|nr:tRNA (adenosine(37)-N6)-threonylcarbamoyltransferase complex ATPase subunit type 1 TsaE [Pseudomonadota bacterium]